MSQQRIAFLVLCLLLWIVRDLAAAAAAPRNATPVRPTAMILVPHAPIAWDGIDVAGADHRQLVAAARGLAESRDALLGLLNARAAEDGQGPGHEVVLDLIDAMAFYDNHQVRPMPIVAPQWRDLAGQSLGRIRAPLNYDYGPGREDLRMSLQRTGSAWSLAEMAMLTSKFRAAFHVRELRKTSFEWNDASLTGAIELVSARGDVRLPMHFSGEGNTIAIPELRQWKDYSSGFWPDWWRGPAERARPWAQSFTIKAAERRGWILKATLRSPEPASGFSTRHQELYAWIEDGRIVRGYAIVPGRLPGRGLEYLVSLARWSVGKGALEAELVLGSDATATNRVRPQDRWMLKASLPAEDEGALTGEYRAIRGESDPATGVLEGRLYHAYAGQYTTGGLDGTWTGPALAGVATLPRAKAQLPPVGTDARLPAGKLFDAITELSRQVAALDWALREYPLPLDEAMRRVRDGCDDRFLFYPQDVAWFMKATRALGISRDVPPSIRPHMHEALASMYGKDGAGAAAYAARLAEIASAAIADRQQKLVPVVGIDSRVDPDFGPYASTGAGWTILDDWTCHGFIMRDSSFETGPYLPELAISPELRPGGQALEVGKPVRLAYPDQGEHLWAWRARPDPVEGRVMIPRECLLLTKAADPRRPWASTTGAGVAEEALDFFYQQMTTWYGTTTIKSASPRRVWMAARIDWDGRVWVNDRLVWRPSRGHTGDQVAVFAADLVGGANRVTVCCSRRPISDGNVGNFGKHTFKHGERAFGTFTVWVSDRAPATPGTPVASAAPVTAPTHPAFRGRRGDGSGRYPDARPPVAWDIDRNINIRWKKSLPTDDAEPVIIGNRLFVSTYTGELACLDAGTGEELWRKKPDGVTVAADYPATAVTASYALPSRMWRVEPMPQVKAHPAYARSCLTPAASATHVWLHDPRGAVACFDHAGKQLWAVSVAAQVPRFAEGGYVATRILPPTHPVARGSRLFAAVGEGLAAFDLATGKTAWRREKLDYLGQFAVMDPVDGGEHLVLLGSGEVLDAATGTTLILRCAPLMSDSACEPVVDGRLAWFHASSAGVRFWRDPAGVLCSRLLWHAPADLRKRQSDMNHHNGDLRTELRFFSRGAYPPTPVLHEGILYEHLGEQMSIDHGPQQSSRLHAVDAMSGMAVSQRYALQLNATHPANSTVIAGGMIFCGDEGGFGKGDYGNFPQTPSYVVMTAEEQPRRITRYQPGLASVSAPQFDGRCMYIAGEDQVVCIARPAELGDRFSDHEIAALRETFQALEIGDSPRLPNDGKTLAIEPAKDYVPGKGVPVVPIESGRTISRWLFAGPFNLDPKVEVMPGTTRPEEGQAATCTGRDGQPTSATFVPLDAKFILDRDWSKKLGNPRLDGAPELASASGWKLMTTCYLYTVLDCRQAGFYEAEFGTSLMRGLDVYVCGQKIAPRSRLELTAGRYPVLVRAAIGTVMSHEKLAWPLRLVWLTPEEARGGMTPIEPQPLAKLPAGAQVPVAPMLLNTMPPRMLGAWPLAGDAPANPYEQMSGHSGALIVEGTQVNWGGKRVSFRPVPAGQLETVDKRGCEDRLHFNMNIGGYGQFGAIERLGLAANTLSGEQTPAAGLFFAVVYNPREISVEVQREAGARAWLSGRECLRDRVIRLKGGFYPFLVEYRLDSNRDKPVVPVTFREVADPDVEQSRWQDRIRRNEALLRRIAASAPAGAWAQELLDAAGRRAEGPQAQ